MGEAIRVLVIDDNEDDRHLYRRLLRKNIDASFDVIEAGNGDEGLAAIEEMAPGCVLLDYSLPGRNGIEVLKRIRSNYPFMPVVMLTGQGNEKVAVSAMREGAQNYISKSALTPADIQHAIEVAIGNCALKKRLGSSEERFRRVVESAPNAMVMINAAGRIEMVNAQAERVFGYPRTELLGQTVEMLVPERFRAHHPQLRQSFFGDPHSRLMGAGRDLYGLRKDGSEFPVEIGLNPIETDDGKMVLSAIVDISDRKQREDRIQAALKEKDILLSEIHHRVKNNLQVIHSLLDLQSSKIEGGIALQLLRESQNRIKSMALIHQALYESKDFARVDFGSFLDSLVPDLVSSYSVDSSRVTLSIESAEVLLPISAAIPCGLIVNELISNAFKHAFPDGRRGEIKVGLTRQSEDRVVLSVSDDGVGIGSEWDLLNATTLGLQLVTLLSDQLGAAITMEHANPTRFILRFKIEP